VKEASEGGYSFEWLVRFMKKEKFNKGDVLFDKGDTADKLYYISQGEIKLPDLDEKLSRGSVLGEMGVFSPHKKRTAKAVCESDVMAYSITQGKIMELYYQNPKFGFYMVQLLSKRYIENIQRLEKSKK
jgi:CRP-like cAMP-binding protein